MPLSTLNIKFGMDIAEVVSGVNKMERELNKITRSISSAQNAIAGGMAAIGGAMVFKKIVDNAVEAQNAMAQVSVAIKSTGGAAGMTAAEVDKLANAMKRQTGIDDDLIKSMASVLLTFTKVGKEVFPQATQAIVDMSVRMGTDLKGAAIQVGKALNDPIKGMTALTKVGVSFTENQKAAVKQMVETGHTMDAQKLILKELQTEFGGAAAAARDTLGGALKALQQNIDDAIDSFSGSNGLREAVEFCNVMLEDFTDYMTGLRQPTSQASKDLEAIGKVIKDVGGFFRGFANVMINGWREAISFGQTFYKGMTDIGVALSKLITVVPALGQIGNAIKSAFPHLELLGKAASFAGQKIKEAASKDNFQYFDGALDRSKKKMEDLAKAAKNVKGPSGGDGSEGDHLSKAQIAAAKKAAAELKKEEKVVHDIVAAYAQKNVELQASLDKNKGLAEQMAAEKKISDQINVPLKERLAAIAEIGRLSRERLEIEKKIAIEAEKVKLTDYLSGLEEANEKLRNKLAGQQELNPLLEAEKKIRDLVKIGLGDNLELQQKIRDTAQEQVDLLKEVDHQAALKELKGISDEQQKQVDQLRLKLNGQEELAGLLEQEKKIRENMNLSDEEKNRAISAGRDSAAQVKQLTNSLEAQQDTLKDITGSSDSYKKKIENLSSALMSGRINSKQWDEASKELWEAQKKNSNQASDFSNKMSEGLNKALSGTKSLKAGLLDMGKTLALLAAQEFVFKPLEKGIKGLANKIFGGGDSLAKPVNPLTGAPGAPILANNTALPNGAVAGFGTADSTNLYSASSTLSEIRDLLKKQTEALASGLTKTSGGLLGLPPMEALGSGRLSTGNSGTSTDQLYKAWDKRMSRSGGNGKDANGANLEDFEYYTRELDRATASQKLGAVKEATNTFKGISNGLNESIKKMTKPLTDAASKVFSPEGGLFSGLKAAFSGIASSISGALNGLFGSLKSSIGGIFGNLFGGSGSGSLLSGLGKAVGSLGSSLMGSVGSWFGGGSGGGGNLLSGLGKAAGSIGSSLMGSLSSWGGLFGLGKRAWGGNVNVGSPYLVGENGPELMIPGASGYVMPNGATRQMMGQDYGGGDALSSLGAWRQYAQDALTSGRPLSYFELQEGNAREADRFRRELDWSSTDEIDYAKVLDGIVKATANAQIEEDRMNGGGGVNFNWKAVANNLQSQDGLGFTRATEAGGRTVFADGNQQRAQLEKAAALGIDIPASLWRKAGMLADAYDQQDSISGGTVQSRSFYNVMGTYMGSGYKSMGMSGNNINNSVFGGDPLDMNNGANGMERYEAFGGKDWQWQKFHNSNLSYGGGNYIGDASYGKRAGGGYGSPTVLRRADQGIVDQYGPTDESNWRPGRTRAQIDQDVLGKYTTRGGIASGTPDTGSNLTRLVEHWTKSGIKGAGLDSLIKMFGGTLPPVAHVPTGGVYGDTWNEQRAADAYYGKLVGNGYKTELGTGAALKQYMDKLLADSRSKFTGSDRSSDGFRSDGSGGWNSTGKPAALHRDSWAAIQNAKLYDNQRTGRYLDTIMKPLDGIGLNRIESHINGIGFGGAVGAPGKLSTSGDVFDQGLYSQGGPAAQLTASQRMNTQYRNFAEGYGDGMIGARLGAFTGATAPRGGWAIKGYALGGRPEPGAPSWVGENGKELFVPDTAGRIIPNNQLNRTPDIKIYNQTGVEFAKPRVETRPDGSIGMYINAAASNSARGGAMAAGNAQAGRSVNR